MSGLDLSPRRVADSLDSDLSPDVLRVAQVTRPAAGGIRRHVSLLCAHLDTQRFAPSLYAPADFTPDIPNVNVPQHRLDIAARTDIAADLRAIRSLTRQLRGQTDLVHAHGLRAALIGVIAARRAGVPSLFTAHNLLPPASRLQRVLLRHIGRTTNAILAVSQAAADTLTAVGLPAAKIKVVPNGVDLAPFDAMPRDTASARTRLAPIIPPDAMLVVGMGRLSVEKGFDVLIRAFATVHDALPNAHLLVVGSGPEAEHLQATNQTANTQRCVHFLGHMNDIVPSLQAADVVAIPSRREGQGIVALEAMAARKAVVASRVGGLVETVLAGDPQSETGLLVPADDSPALADALIALLRDAPRRDAMGQRGRARVEQCYTIERMILNIENVYGSLAP